MRSLAKVTCADIAIEDHGIPTMDVIFSYEEGCAQGLAARTLDAAFVFRFMRAIGVDKLSKAKGRSCWVTHSQTDISVIEPLHKDEGTAFVIEDWRRWRGQYPLWSAAEMESGATADATGEGE